MTETAENYLSGLGFTDFRVRMMGRIARLQVPDSQMGHVLEKREEILDGLKKYYAAVLLDLEARG